MCATSGGSKGICAPLNFPAPSWCAVVPQTNSRHQTYTYTPFGGISLLIAGHTLCCPAKWSRSGDGSKCHHPPSGESCYLYGNDLNLVGGRPCPSLTALYTREVTSAVQWTDFANTEPTAGGGIGCSASGCSTAGWGSNFAHSLDTLEERASLRGVEFKFTDAPKSEAMVGLEHGLKDDWQMIYNTSYAHFTMYKAIGHGSGAVLSYFEQGEIFYAHTMPAPDLDPRPSNSASTRTIASSTS